MAKAPTKDAAAGAGSEAPKKGKKVMLIMIVAIVVTAVVAAGGVWFFLGGSGGDTKHSQKEKKKKRDDEKPPIYTKLEPFTVNLAGESSDHYLQAGIELKVADEAVTAKIKLHMPEITDGIIQLLSSKQREDVATREGRDKLRMEIRDQVNKVIDVQDPEEGVMSVLLTSFVIQ